MEGCVTQQSGILEVCRNNHHVDKRQKRGGIDSDPSQLHQCLHLVLAKGQRWSV